MLRFRALLLFSLAVLPTEAGVEVLTPRFQVLTEMPAEAALQAADDLERTHASLKGGCRKVSFTKHFQRG